ncbi:dihydrodipicolinate synthase family protein [Poriferisphaera sp. WC338]|uniref:dihydrodipicolinate synthase family protein n=1 Tax=Poriferisphaera sp. WC338 TaxID=3425129 RepID=UPI003D81B09C
MQKRLPKGVWPVMLTPFTENNQLDIPGYRQLVDFYIQQQAAGLFATCGSSEVYLLTADEIVQLTEEAVTVAKGHVPVVAGAICHGEVNKQIDLAKRLAQTGIAAVVFNASQIITKQATDQDWFTAIDRLITELPDTPLGIYECPTPYHRLLTDTQIKHLADSKRFIFFKDTCKDSKRVAARLKQTVGSPIAYFDAHAPHIFDTLAHGIDGHCGVGSNLCIELFVWLCNNHRNDPQTSKQVHQYINSLDPILDIKYPASVKIAMQARNINIQQNCRIFKDKITQDSIDLIYKTIDDIQSRHQSITTPALSS